MEQLLDIKQVAARLRVTERTINNWIKDKGLPSILIAGNTRRFDPDAVEDWVKRQSVVN